MLMQRITLFMALLSLCLILLTSAYAASQGNKNNIIIITIDTLRTDFIGVTGERKIHTPTIDAIANEGVLFTHVFSPAPLTLPSHTSIFTGTYPPSHKVRNNGQIFNNSTTPLLSSLLKHQRYHKYAVTGSYVLRSHFGLAKDFDYYSNVTNTKPASEIINTQSIERNADEVLSESLKILKTIKEPFLLWIHFFDPHAPYTPPRGFPKGDKITSYQGEIEYTDTVINKLIKVLKISNNYDNAII